MKNEKILYKDGHYCQPNGVGDWDFICPEKGTKPGFIPFFIAWALSGTCACGKKIEREEESK